MNIELTKDAIIKTDYFISVYSDTKDGAMFQNLPNQYTKNDVIIEYERCVKYDLETLFDNCDASLDNISYSCGLFDIHNDEKEEYEDSYIIYLTKEEKEMIKQKLECDFVLSGIFVKIDDKLYR